MSTQSVNPKDAASKSEKSEKNTDATAVLSPEELRAIAGGVNAGPGPKVPPPTPNVKIGG